MSEPLISVIVPIYNVEKYLDRCIMSIVNQIYKNLEIILVDDGSPDQCPQKCDEWKEKDDRIVVIHKENGGLSDARNAGLDIATGEYISFVDSDDWVSQDFIDVLYTGIKLYSASISVCDVNFVYNENNIYNDNYEYKYITYTRENAMNDIVCGKGIRATAWNKLYKKSLLSNMRFEKSKYHEDEFFTYKVIDKACKIVFTSKKLYFYFQRNNSIMSTVSMKHLDFLEALFLRLLFLEKKYPNLYLKAKISYCIACVDHYKQTFYINNIDTNLYRTKVKEYRKKITFSRQELNSLTLKNKMYAVLSKYFLFLFSYILYLKGAEESENT